MLGRLKTCRITEKGQCKNQERLPLLLFFHSTWMINKVEIGVKRCWPRNGDRYQAQSINVENVEK